MKKLILIVGLLITFCITGNYKAKPIHLPPPKYTLVEKDSLGLVVTYKEKYGLRADDSCTILLEDKYSYVLVRRDLTKKIIMKSNLNTITWKGKSK